MCSIAYYCLCCQYIYGFVGVAHTAVVHIFLLGGCFEVLRQAIEIRKAKSNKALHLCQVVRKPQLYRSPAFQSPGQTQAFASPLC